MKNECPHDLHRRQQMTNKNKCPHHARLMVLYPWLKQKQSFKIIEVDYTDCDCRFNSNVSEYCRLLVRAEMEDVDGA